MEVVNITAVTRRRGSTSERSPAVVTVGAYDGVHLGHRAVIGRVIERARQLDVRSAVVTFDRHPAMVVRPESAPPLLCDTEQKLELLASTGVDVTAVVHFDDERMHESPEDFVTEVLVDSLDSVSVIVGHDFHFGAGRKGNVSLLASMGAELGFEVTGMNLIAEGSFDETVSSTRIRGLIAAGDVATASRLLGRPHEVRGLVEHGDKRGRELGFPTANVSIPEFIALPAEGVYAGWFDYDGIKRPAAISLGRRPTFYSENGLMLLEAHLLDFDGQLYGERARVGFVEHLRAQQRYESAEALIRQMAIDVGKTRGILSPGSGHCENA